ncbi:MAG: PAS domain S-box protein [Verrucomicrobiota bacterium]
MTNAIATAAVRDERRNGALPLDLHTINRAASADRLRATIEASIDSVITINAESEILEFNAAAERSFGRRREDVIGKAITEIIIPPSLREGHRRGMAALLKTGHGKILGKRVEVPAMRADGSEFPVELTVTRIPGQGSPIFTAFIRDITERKAAEEMLRSQEEQYRLLFETNPSPMWVYDVETLRFLTVNEAAISQYGYSREEFLSRTLRDIRPVEDVDKLEQTVHEAGAPAHSGQWRHLRKDGTVIIASIYSCPTIFEHRAARMTIATDVTEREHADRKLRQSEASLALAQRVAHIGSWEVDLTNREDRAKNPPRWSDETFQIFGFEPGAIEVTRDSFFHLLHPEERQLARDTFIQQLRTGERYSVDHRIVRPDGTQRIVNVQSDTVRDSTGRLVKTVGTVQDITESRRAERMLREQAELISLAQDAILVHNLDGMVRMWNLGAERLYGWTANEMLGKRVADLLSQDTGPAIIANDILLQNGEWRGELQQVCKDGRKIIVSCRWTLVRDERGEPESVLVINTDMTEQKKLEAQFLRSQRLESIGTLAAGVAHDLNNILAPILLVTPLLRGDLAGEDKEKFLSLVQTSAERGAKIVKQVLTFARGADGARVPVQPIYLMEEVARITGETFPKSITIRTHYPENLWLVDGDPTELQQVLLNLCVNARDAMPEGGTLRLMAENFEVDDHYASMTPGAKPGPHVLIQVTDNGSGIPRQVIDKIFDPFFTTKEVGSGTGLGLSTVLGIVKSYGGFVNVYSEAGHTTFRVFLPANASATLEAGVPEPISLPSGCGETILVVDDEPTIRDAAQSLLLRHGYKVLVADDGIAALAIFAQQASEIDLVLTDIVMPLMDGLTLVRTLRKMNPETKIILSSGREEDRDCLSPELNALRLQACLTKPYTRAKLLITLSEVLHRQVAATI